MGLFAPCSVCFGFPWLVSCWLCLFACFAGLLVWCIWRSLVLVRWVVDLLVSVWVCVLCCFGVNSVVYFDMRFTFAC